MLKYTHVFNTIVDYPYHIHMIESDTTSVAINLNGKLIGYFKPNTGNLYQFDKYLTIPSILELMVVGSRQSYSTKIDNSFFKDATVKYIQDSRGWFLVKNNLTGGYFWSTTERTRFFFNPEYFSSNILWNYTIGYVPAGKVVNDVWEESAANDLFLSQVYVTDESWGGEKIIADVDPIELLPFDNSTTGLLKTLGVDSFIDELQDLVNGDVITINNGTETVEVTVGNITTDAIYEVTNITTRPIGHVNIDIINPNKKIVYSKALVLDVEETINLELYSNNIQFTMKRITDG